MEKEMKVRKIGNSVGVILPKEMGLHENDVIDFKREGNVYYFDITRSAKEQDRKLIEESFQDFEKGLTLTEKEMKKTFGKYGWGE